MAEKDYILSSAIELTVLAEQKERALNKIPKAHERIADKLMWIIKFGVWPLTCIFIIWYLTH